MSQLFYQKFTGLFFGSMVLLVLLIVSSEFLVLYLLNLESQAYYFGYLLMLAFSGIFGFKYYWEYHGFRESLEQGLLSPGDVERVTNSFDLEPITDIPADRALAVCTYYRNGASLTDIQRSMGFHHPEQVRRTLLKGLDVLLKEHKEKVKI